ncbi:thioesterase superfamily protein [Saccharopolyspora erythraea NRRL 2338]|uniref:Uncharacterized protein n=2 Tax=Saccharopolyspora erythraea TaxID=1836 RepID=A4FH64_SACEN|nr:thioesterase family protein [Saccharopolyspora erythraea]EQD82703.1 hypothetical protein N599_29185 [Saccharopolyspora erythraea D]PFG97089.1 thioesterase superfamily protein [Saccharopolyspora erythraea NRRL 2338]QRK87299.1 thioesterase family protein [Saccharopolyspora erythraea]CAM03389.1 hypothetical protein SACE_4119 [Saccharopolyspora erythraea NRRL 2338]
MSAAPAWSPGPACESWQAAATAAGPWSPDRVHGGAVNALLGHLLGAVAADSRGELVRVTVDLLRPVPLEPLTARTHLLRDGRRYSVADATLCAGTPVARAAALFAVRDQAGERTAESSPPLTPPEKCLPHHEHVAWPSFNGQHLQIRFDPDPPDGFAAVAWVRPRTPLVAGCAPVCGVLAASDLLTGLSGGIGADDRAALNVDSTVHLERSPRPGWIGIAAHPLVRRSGAPVAEGIVHDEHGRVGSVRQSTVLVPV